MRVQFKSDESASDSGVVTKEMTIDSKKKSKLIAILSSNLYRDRIMSVIREICSNAYDAHIMAGNTDVPFSMTVPTWEHQYFEVRDYGIGLTPEKAEETIFCYLGSDKDDSDDFIGGWGLGSKSPFAYTNAFEVTLYKDGRYWQYNQWLDKFGLPFNAVYEEGDTDEPDGVLVKVPVTPSDVHKFKYSCATYLSSTNFNVTLKNPDACTVNRAKYLFSFESGGHEFHITDHESGGELLMLYGGFIYQAMDLKTSLESETVAVLDSLNTVFTGYSIVVHTKVGQCEFQPSREAMSGSEHTVNYLNGVITALINYLNGSVQKYEADFLTPINAYVKVQKDNKHPLDIEYLFGLVDKANLDSPFKFADYKEFRKSSLLNATSSNYTGILPDNLSVPLRSVEHRYADKKKFNYPKNLKRIRRVSKTGRITASGTTSDDALSLDLTSPLHRQYVFMYHDCKLHKQYMTGGPVRIDAFVRYYSVEAGSLEEAEGLYEQMGVKGFVLRRLDDVINLSPKDKQRNSVHYDVPKAIQDVHGNRWDYDPDVTYIDKDPSMSYKCPNSFLRLGSETFHFVRFTPTFLKKYSGKLPNLMKADEFVRKYSKAIRAEVKLIKAELDHDRMVRTVKHGVELSWLGIGSRVLDDIMSFGNKRCNSSDLVARLAAVRMAFPGFEYAPRINFEVLSGTIKHSLENTALRFFNWSMVCQTNREEAKTVALSLLNTEV